MRGKFVEGPITPYIASLLEPADGPASAASDALTETERLAVRRELARLGLIALG